ncbi:hypothetical protein FKP32DRAFT_1579516 [Trametes sanguinea]|nr:hypothetical protein FKP32DRAFT_1579516 [Trametes sanguinea]
MDTVPDRPRLKSWLYDSKVRRIKDPEAQPSRDELSQRTFCAEVWINGVKALALFDSGCTTDSITPELAYLSKADRIDLTEPVGLQLGTKGSRTKINYGARATLKVQHDIPNHYFDVVDIDKYDMVLGTTFCRKHKVVLDFIKDRVVVDGTTIELFRPEIPSKAVKGKIQAATKSGSRDQPTAPK